MNPKPNPSALRIAALALSAAAASCASHAPTLDKPHNETSEANRTTVERQITLAPCGHILTNANVWSPDGQWLVFDTRSDADGTSFDSPRIQRVDVSTGEVQTLYESRDGAFCGVPTCSPVSDEVAFILGPERPTPDWTYAASHRQGVIVDARRPGIAANLDARDLAPRFTPGALRGGSHVHVFSPDGTRVSFTYEDALLPSAADPARRPGQDANARNVGVGVRPPAVIVPRGNPRNHDGTFFTVLATHTAANPAPGSDQIARAFEESWIGTRGYIRPDGSRQRRALAFQGEVTSASGRKVSEVFVVDLPENLTRPGSGPLAGTPDSMPAPPAGAAQRRITRTADRKFPGIQGPRHWLKSSPDGSRIGLLMRDDDGIVQFWTVSPNGGEPVQVTRDAWDVASAFSWSPDGRQVAYIADNSLFTVDVASGTSVRRIPRTPDATRPLPLACVFSPDGRQVAYLRRAASAEGTFNQIFVATLPPDARATAAPRP